MQNNIVTERLSLDLLTLNDHEFILQLVNSKGWIEFIGDRNVHSTQDAVAYVNKILYSDNIYYWVVRMKDENKPIGIISFLKRNYLEHFDIGFAFLPQFNSYGYAHEAVIAILAMLNELPQYHPILATTMPDNTSSIKLLLKLGLHFEKEIQVGKEKLHIYSNADQNKATGSA